MRRGNIGIVGASGTGSRELSVRIHEFGGGVSQLIGTGGRDLSEKIGGLMMLDAIGMLENDPQTEIIVLISKPPAPAVARKVLERARACRKPVVVCFLGRGETPVDEQGATVCSRQQRSGTKSGDALRYETRTSRLAYPEPAVDCGCACASATAAEIHSWPVLRRHAV